MRKADDARLGRTISHSLRERENTCNGGDVDDLAASFLQHMRNRSLRREENSCQIDVDRLAPHLLAMIEEGANIADARIVDENVDRTEMLGRAVRHLPTARQAG